jgi:superoxide dismutase, Fe-Mn family
MNRRESIKAIAVASAAVASPFIVRNAALAQTTAPPTASTPAATPAGATSVFKLPELGYAYDALEPHIDTATMKIHHTAHHQTFINNLNGLVEKYPDLATKTPVEIVSNLAAVPEAVRMPIRNSMGGHFNHTFFWQLMTPGGAKMPTGDLKTAIDGTFGSFEKLAEEVNKAGATRFGSGWAWLGVNKDKKLVVFNTPYQDTPHMDAGAKPVIGVDVWEHAYYLKHQSKRGDYLKAWWNTVNWDKAAANFKAASV